MVGMYYVWNKELYLTFIHTFAVLILGTFIAHTIVVKDRLFSRSPEESTNQAYSSCFYTANVLSAKSTDECLRTKSQDN
jgi:hypothetical protein